MYIIIKIVYTYNLNYALLLLKLCTFTIKIMYSYN